MIVDTNQYLYKLTLIDCYILAAYGYFVEVENGEITGVCLERR